MARAARSSGRARVDAGQLTLRDDVPFHRLASVAFRPSGGAQRIDVERVHMEMIVMGPVFPGWAGAAESGLSKVVHAGLADGGALSNDLRRGRNVVEHPVGEGTGRRVRIFADDRDALRILRNAAPFERRRDVPTVARVLLRNVGAVRKFG